MSKIFPLRLSEEERASFQSAADKEGMKLSAWLRRAATRTAELEEATLKEETTWPGYEIDQKAKQEVLQQAKDRIYPQSREKCPHRLNPGAWCKTCKRVK